MWPKTESSLNWKIILSHYCTNPFTMAFICGNLSFSLLQGFASEYFPLHGLFAPGRFTASEYIAVKFVPVVAADFSCSNP